MKQILFLFTTLVLFSSLSCDNDPTTTIIEGHVLQKETLNPVANAKLLIYQEYSKGLFQGFVEWPIDTVVTDEQGHFRWETDIDPYNKTYNSLGAFFIKRVDAPDHFKIVNNDLVSRQVRHLEHRKTAIIMTPHAYLRLHVEDVEEIEGSYCRVWGDRFNDIDDLYGESLNDVFIVGGNTTTVINYKFNSIPGSAIQDSFYIPALDTLDYFLKY